MIKYPSHFNCQLVPALLTFVPVEAKHFEGDARKVGDVDAWEVEGHLESEAVPKVHLARVDMLRGNGLEREAAIAQIVTGLKVNEMNSIAFSIAVRILRLF